MEKLFSLHLLLLKMEIREERQRLLNLLVKCS
nr:MAG TPA_asm: hypothetical protein [Caudoviricetes sp.]